MRTVITGGLIAHHKGSFHADIAFENGVIVTVGEKLARQGDKVVDATGRIVMPGGVDAHTHVALSIGDLSVSDGWRLGTLAAAFGGTTTIVEHISNGPEGCSLFHMPERFRDEAEGEAVTDYGLHAVVQRVDEGILAETPRMVAAGYPTFKAYMTYASRLDDHALIAIMDALARHKGLLTVHAENHEIIAWLTAKLRAQGHTDPTAHPLSRPGYCESEAVYRLIGLASAAEAGLYVVHLSTTEGLAHIEKAQHMGVPVLAETCPQYLLLTDEVYASGDQACPDAGLSFVMAPPPRQAADTAALWEGLRSGSVAVVATDHCSFSMEQKRRLGGGNVFTCPGGAPGIETRLPLLYSEGVLKGRLTLERFVDVVSTAPARIMGLADKGVLEPGKDADIVLLNPAEERVLSAATLHQHVDYTPFAGMRVRGWPDKVWLRGRPLIDEGRFVGEAGCGRFVPRQIA